MAKKISEMESASTLDGNELVEIVKGGTNKRTTIGAIANAAGALSWKNSVRVATTANITLSGTQTIDGVAVIAADRVLVKNQTTQTENGIYVVAAGAWSRATDADTGTELNNAVVSVDSGTTNADTSWRQTTDNVTVGTSNIIWSAFEGTPIYRGTAAGTNTYTVTVTPAITAYANYQTFLVKFTNANTGASTLNANSLGAKTLVKNGSTALSSGDISAGQAYLIMYDGTNLQILGRISAGVSGLTANRVTFAASATSLTDDPEFTYDGTSNRLSVRNINGGSTNVLTLQYDTFDRVKIGSAGVAIGPLVSSADRMLHVGTTGSGIGYAARFRNEDNSGTPAIGIGTGIEFETETSNGNYEIGATIETVTTDVTGGSEDFDVVIKIMAAGAAAAERVRIKGTSSAMTLYRDTGWTLPTGTASKAGFDTATATLTQVAQTVKAMMDHLMTNMGLFGT